METTVLFLYLVAVLLRQAKCFPERSTEAVKMVASLLKLPTMELYDSKLYTPTPNDYKNCSSSMLKCFQKEAAVLISETLIANFNNLPRMLSQLRLHLQDKMKPCPDCEVYKEQKVQIFLTNLLEVLEMINSRTE